MSSALMAPNPDAAEILLRVYHGSGVTRAELTESLGMRAGVVAAALDAFTDANLILLDEHWYYPSLNGDTDVAARREYARLSGARSCQNCHRMEHWDGIGGGCDWLLDGLCSDCHPDQASLSLLTPEVLTQLLADVQAAQAQVEASRHLHRNQASGILGAFAGSIRDVLSGALPMLAELNPQQDGAL